MLYQLPLIIEALTPVVFSDKSGAAILTGTKDYFSGSAIKGALAAAYLRNNAITEAEKDAVFHKLFLSGSLRFVPAYIQNADKQVAQPMPASLFKSKLPEGAENKCRIIDLASGQEAKAGYKAMGGFAFFKGTAIAGARVDKTIELHMSRSSAEERIVGSSKDGRLYNYEAIKQGQTFCGYIEGTEADLKEFIKIANSKMGFANGTAVVYFGRSKQTQYGKCRLELQSVQPKTTPVENSADSLFLYAYTDFMPSQNMYIEISQALEELVRAVATRVPCTLGRVFASQGEAEGFVGVWGLKRPQTRAIKAGAVIELVKAGGGTWTKAELEAVQAVLEGGLGKRRADGYGQFTIWSAKSWTLADKPTAKMAQPPKEIPAEVKRVAGGIIKKYIKERLQLFAAEDVDSIKNIHNHNPLFSRLEMLIDAQKNIEEEIPQGTPAARNLHSLKLGPKSLYEILTGYENKAIAVELKCPYAKRLQGIADGKLKQLMKQVDYTLPIAEDRELYNTYWLWFCRLARINEGKEGETNE